MKRGKSILTLLATTVIIAVTTIMVSCGGNDSVADSISDDITNADSLGLVRLSVMVEKDANAATTRAGGVATRAISTSNENSVNNVIVFIFDSDGNICNYDQKGERAGYKFEGSSLHTTSTGVIEVTLWTRKLKGTTVYAVANIPSTTPFQNIKTKAQFDQLKTTALSSATEIGNGSSLLMFGSLSNFDTTVGNASFQLYHICAKVNVNFVLSNGVTLESYQLFHVPTQCWYSSSSVAGTRTQSFSYTDFGANATTRTATADNTTVAAGPFYINESLVGKGSNTNSNGWAGRYASTAAANASYLLVYAHTETWRSAFRIYLGGNNLPSTTNTTYDYTDYSIYRNAHYTITVNINGGGRSEDGLRVTYQARVQFADPGVTGYGDNSGTASF